jgi:hypothetical protein
MKRLLAILFIGFASLHSKAQLNFGAPLQSTPFYKPDTILRYTGNGGTLTLSDKIMYSYDGSGRITRIESGYEFLGTYNPTTKLEYTYGSGNIPLTIYDYTYQNNTWKIRAITLRTVNSIGKVISEKYSSDIGSGLQLLRHDSLAMANTNTPATIEGWSLNNNQFQKNFKADSIIYDAQNRLTAYIFSSWTGTQYYPNYKYSNISWKMGFGDLFQLFTNSQYDDFSGLIYIPYMDEWKGYTGARQYSWNGLQWTDLSKTIERTNNNLLSEVAVASVNFSNPNQWDTLQRYSFWFNSNNQFTGYKTGNGFSGTFNYNDSVSCVYAPSSNRIVERKRFTNNGSTWAAMENYSFRWYFDNNQRLTAISGVNAANNGEVDSLVMRYSTTTSINELSNDVSFNIFPNPSNDDAYIYVDASVSNAQIEIVDMQGRMIRRENANCFPWKVSVEGLNNGFYAVKLIHNSGESSKKLIISR